MSELSLLCEKVERPTRLPRRRKPIDDNCWVLAIGRAGDGGRLVYAIIDSEGRELARGFRCPYCARLKDPGEFGRNASQPSGLDSACLVCKRKYMRRWRERNREAYNAASRQPPSEGMEARES